MPQQAFTLQDNQAETHQTYQVKGVSFDKVYCGVIYNDGADL